LNEIIRSRLRGYRQATKEAKLCLEVQAGARLNTDKLRELIERILEVEAKADTQTRLNHLASALANLAGTPQNADYQTQLATALKQFASSMSKFQVAFSPRDYERVLELSNEAFSPSMVEEITESISQNVMSPIVANLHSKRNEVFTRLRELQTTLEYFHFGYVEPEPGEAELGFQIPRELFENNLPGFIKELRDLELIIKFFSEAELGKYEPAEVGSISTSDPLVFLSMAEPVAKAIGLAVSWAVATWLGVEKIRKLRAETAQLKSFSEEEVENIFGTKIKQEIKAAVDTKVAEILENSKASKTRQPELGAHLTKALEALLAKIERGMTIELRIGPAPLDDDTTDDADDVAASHQELLDIQAGLVFPKPSDSPILSIPELKDDKPARTRQ
jgi:hypothetical protein